MSQVLDEERIEIGLEVGGGRLSLRVEAADQATMQRLGEIRRGQFPALRARLGVEALDDARIALLKLLERDDAHPRSTAAR